MAKIKQKQLKTQNKQLNLSGATMYDNEYYPIHHLYKTNSATQVTISDVKSSNHFGILLSTQQSVEEFQNKSGMMKQFTTEYQYHYWALVARIKIENQILDIAIPTVMFNYEQEVNGAAVDFHLNNVEEASTRNQPTAEAIAGVLVASSFGKYLEQMFKGNIEWINVPMNTCHVHPGNLSTFSGIDYKKTISDPGICFPLAEPQEQTSFSSIICHGPADEEYAGKIVRTEYRCANKIKNTIEYLHGTCLSYWRGHTVVGYKNKLPVLQSIFSNKQFEEKADVIKPSYITIDGIVVVENNEMLKSIINEFDKIEFSPHTEDIVASRIIAMKHKVYGNSYGVYKKQTPQPSINTQFMSLIDLREFLIKSGYAPTTVYGWDYQKCNTIYNNLVAIDDSFIPAKTTKLQHENSNGMNVEEQIKFLLANGVSSEEIKGKNTVAISTMTNLLIMEIEQEEALDELEIADMADKEYLFIPDYKSNKKVLKFLEGYGISMEVIMNMSNEEIDTLLEATGF